ncbi:MAG: DUF952 domain-containing protein [Oligoflexales bacterium]|nr:DUF952 domain-containing protein [Oligoflexales bacterium]
MTKQPKYLYKITTEALWEQSRSQDTLALSPDDNLFIHLAEKNDIDRIIKKFFHQEKRVVIIKLDLKKLSGRLVKEKNPGGEREYYHLYEGKILKSAIITSDLKI